MDEALHPSTLSEILDRTAQIYRIRFLVFLGIAAIPTATLLALGGGIVLIVVWLGSAGDGHASTVAAGFVAVAGLGLLTALALLAVTALATAALNHAAACVYLGRAITIRGSYKAVWQRGWRFIGLFVVQAIAIWVLPFGAWFVLVMLSAGLGALAQTAGLGGGGLIVLGGVLVVIGLVVYGFWMALRLSLAFPACVVEQVDVWDALRRSAALARGTKGRILLLYLLGMALNWILSVAVTIPLTIIVALLPGANSPQHAQTISTVLIVMVYGAGFAVQAFTRPIYGIALMLFYYDQRIRHEGFDIEWMMMKAGLVTPAGPQPTEPSTPALGEQA